MKKIMVTTIFCIAFLLNSCQKNDDTSDKTVANFSVSGYDRPAPCTINLINSSKNATNYEWKLGDGTSSNNANVTKIFTAIGTYYITLKVSGPKGTDSVCKALTLDQPVTPNNSAFNYFMDKCTGTPVNVQFYSINPQSRFHAWDFGEGTTSPEANPIVRFNIPGNYTIKYSSQIGTLRDTIIRAIQIF
jgi:PKD repeat protein